MKNLEALTKEQVAPETQEIFDALKQKVGMVPNLYATVANSHKALTTMLSATETLGSGEFTGKEVEAIALAVGQVNGCGYCLSAHTTIGKMQGFTEDDTLAIRRGEVSDDKIISTHSFSQRDHYFKRTSCPGIGRPFLWGRFFQSSAC